MLSVNSANGLEQSRYRAVPHHHTSLNDNQLVVVVVDDD
jgi:hypothetical protein